MRIPNTVEVNGEIWKVVRRSLAAKGLAGRCVYRKNEIQIEEALPDSEVAEVFLHELMHACLPERFGSAVEERMVLNMAPRLLEALKGMGWVR